jgi:hypothetical protein
MNKKTKFKLNESLDKALAAPKRDRSKLDSLLDEYTDKPAPFKTEIKTKPVIKAIETLPIIEKSTLTRQSTQTSQTRQSEKSLEIAPMRDYQKVPNSITKQAIPDGLFKPGKSKLLYDVLYSLTRGAIEPVRKLRISKTKLMKLAGIGSRITFDSIVSQFEMSGLVRVIIFAGEHEGNEFEVFLPEETSSLTRLTTLSSQTSHAQKLDRVVSLETSQTRQSLNAENKEAYSEPKTLFKTLRYIDDDAPLISAIERLNAAARKATGKDLTRKDLEAFEEIISLLIDETSIAEARAKSISVYLKFAAENLRRRLYPKISAKKFNGRENSTSLDVGKNNAEPEPLGEYRNDVLESFKNLVQTHDVSVLDVFHQSYTADDWNWLIENLEIEEGNKQ